MIRMLQVVQELERLPLGVPTAYRGHIVLRIRDNYGGFRYVVEGRGNGKSTKINIAAEFILNNLKRWIDR